MEVVSRLLETGTDKSKKLTDVEEIEEVNLMAGWKSAMKSVKCCYSSNDANAVMDVTFIKFRKSTLILLANKIFKISRKNAGIVRTHVSTHGNSTTLILKMPIKFKWVQIKD